MLNSQNKGARTANSHGEAFGTFTKANETIDRHEPEYHAWIGGRADSNCVRRCTFCKCDLDHGIQRSGLHYCPGCPQVYIRIGTREDLSQRYTSGGSCDIPHARPRDHSSSDYRSMGCGLGHLAKVVQHENPVQTTQPELKRTADSEDSHLSRNTLSLDGGSSDDESQKEGAPDEDDIESQLPRSNHTLVGQSHPCTPATLPNVAFWADVCIGDDTITVSMKCRSLERDAIDIMAYTEWAAKKRAEGMEPGVGLLEMREFLQMRREKKRTFMRGPSRSTRETVDAAKA